MNKEKRYIKKRKFQAFLHSLQFYVCRVFPIRKNRIAVCTFEGKGGFGCNPKYIVEELHRRNPDLEIVWMVNDLTKEFPAYIKKVPNTNWSRAYWMSTAKVWIDNYRTRYGTKKRKGQYYLNTNHYTICIKRVGIWRGEGFSPMAYLVSQSDAEQIDDMLSDSVFCDEMYPKGLLYNKPLKYVGAPRCDILLGDRSAQKEQFRVKHGLPKDAKVVMYAPTFREGAKNGVRSVYSEEWSLDFGSMLDALAKRFGGDWYLCIRVHPQLAPLFRGYSDDRVKNRIIDESSADDMNELLAAMDAYITDYSSACFEAGFSGMPVFLYADDLETYVRSRGGLFWRIEEADNRTKMIIDTEIFKQIDVSIPFPIAKNNDELLDDIASFDEAAYIESLQEFHNRIHLCFDGVAALRVAELVEAHLNR